VNRKYNNFWSWVVIGDPLECWNFVGNINTTGYGRFTSRGRRWLAHRYAFTCAYGDIPLGMEIDHACRNRSCVNPEHLRVATHRENMRNMVANKDNISGFKGVTQNHKRWMALITVDYKIKYLGTFDTPEEAHLAYQSAAKQYHKDFANFGVKQEKP